MSYCRFIEADAYIYEDARGGITCQGCSLMPRPDDPHHLLGSSFNAPTRGEMLDHVRRHRAAGHRIPLDVDQRLEWEIAKEGDDPIPPYRP